jgi:hypothetical protein
LTFPSSAGSNGQVLTTNGSGSLSWSTASGGASSINNLTDGYALVYTGTTGGDIFLGRKPTSPATYWTTAVGIGAMNSIGTGNTGYGNTMIGYNAGASLTNEALNTAVGATSQHDALGSQNTTVGWETGFTLGATAVGNVALGFRSYRNQTDGDYNIAIGYDPLYAGGSGSNNIAIGFEALKGDDPGTPNTGSLNIAIGKSIAVNATSAGSNVIVGHDAAGALTTGSTNTLIGYGTGALLTTGSGNVMIGNAAGANASATTSNQLFIDNSSTSTPLIGGDFSTDALTFNGSTTTTGATYYTALATSGSTVQAVASSGASATLIASSFTGTYQTVTVTNDGLATAGYVRLPAGTDGQVVYLRMAIQDLGTQTITLVNSDNTNTLVTWDGTGSDVFNIHMMYTTGENWVIWQAIRYDNP